MGTYLDTPNRYGGMSDHTDEIVALGEAVATFHEQAAAATSDESDIADDLLREALIFDTARLMLVCHDETGHNLTAGSAGPWLALVEDCLHRLGFRPNDDGDLVLSCGA